MNPLSDHKIVRIALAISGVEKRTSPWLENNIGERQMATDDVYITKNQAVVARLRLNTPWRNKTAGHNKYNGPRNHALQEIENFNVHQAEQLDEFEENDEYI